MKPEHIQAELERGQESLEAARVLLHARLYADAISRAYYAVMHSARAALLFHDEITESHAALRNRFGTVLVRPGLVEREWARILAAEEDERMTADYQASVGSSPETCRECVSDAERFVGRIRRYLAEQGPPTEEGGPTG